MLKTKKVLSLQKIGGTRHNTQASLMFLLSLALSLQKILTKTIDNYETDRKNIGAAETLHHQEKPNRRNNLNF